MNGGHQRLTPKKIWQSGIKEHTPDPFNNKYVYFLSNSILFESIENSSLMFDSIFMK